MRRCGSAVDEESAEDCGREHCRILCDGKRGRLSQREFAILRPVEAGRV